MYLPVMMRSFYPQIFFSPLVSELSCLSDLLCCFLRTGRCQVVPQVYFSRLFIYEPLSSVIYIYFFFYPRSFVTLSSGCLGCQQIDDEAFVIHLYFYRIIFFSIFFFFFPSVVLSDLSSHHYSTLRPSPAAEVTLNPLNPGMPPRLAAPCPLMHPPHSCHHIVSGYSAPDSRVPFQRRFFLPCRYLHSHSTRGCCFLSFFFRGYCYGVRFFFFLCISGNNFIFSFIVSYFVATQLGYFLVHIVIDCIVFMASRCFVLS